MEMLLVFRTVGRRVNATDRGGRHAAKAARSLALVEASSVGREETPPLSAATWLAGEVTIDFRDGEGAAMDASEPSTHWSASGANGDLIALCRLVGERLFLLKEKTEVRGFGGVGVGRGGGLMGVGIHCKNGASLSSSVVISAMALYVSSWTFS